MEFYVGWYPGDPDYAAHDRTCALLISITSVARDWTIRALPHLPRKLLIDSGGYRFAMAQSESLSPAEVLIRQLRLIEDTRVPTIVSALDYPILQSNIRLERDHRITQTIAAAYELKYLVEKGSLPTNVTPMAVIQGESPDALRYCSQELKAIGFPLYGIGSLAELRQPRAVLERVEAVAEIISPSQLHVFGVSNVYTVRALSRLGVSSIDSTRPAKAAMYNEVIYSRPYQRYGILEPEEVPIKGRMPQDRRLSSPLPCACPTCRENPTQILQVGKRDAIRGRALHNYYHLKREFAFLTTENEMDESHWDDGY